MKRIILVLSALSVMLLFSCKQTYLIRDYLPLREGLTRVYRGKYDDKVWIDTLSVYTHMIDTLATYYFQQKNEGKKGLLPGPSHFGPGLYYYKKTDYLRLTHTPALNLKKKA